MKFSNAQAIAIVPGVVQGAEVQRGEEPGAGREDPGARHGVGLDDDTPPYTECWGDDGDFLGAEIWDVIKG